MRCVGKKHESLRAGFTLAEALLAVVLLGIAASSVLLPFTTGTVVRKDGARRSLASNLASEQMEKVIRTSFSQIIPTWNNTIENAGQLKDAQGNTLTGSIYASFSRTTTCKSVLASQQAGVLSSSLISIKVEVLYKGDPLVTLNRLVSE
jgi:type II secretory pathway pseudopilin PulG